MLFLIITFLSLINAVVNQSVGVEVILLTKTPKQGQDIKLFCNVEQTTTTTTVPQTLQFVWFLNGNRLMANKRISFSELDPDSSALVVKNSSLEDAGNYTCKVINSTGSWTASHQVNVEGKKENQKACVQGDFDQLNLIDFQNKSKLNHHGSWNHKTSTWN